MLEMQKLVLIVLCFLLFNLVDLKAQSNSSVGVFISPVIYSPNYLFYTVDNTQQAKNFGISINFELNKNWRFSIKPILVIQEFNSSNLDTVASSTNSSNPVYSKYFVSNFNGYYTGNIKNKNIDLEFCIVYKFIKHKYSKWGKYIYLGNTIRYNISYEDVVKKNDTQEIVYNFKGKSSEIMQYFQPTVGLGIEYLITKNSGIFSDIFYKTFRNNYFDNFTLGLALGIKAKL